MISLSETREDYRSGRLTRQIIDKVINEEVENKEADMKVGNLYELIKKEVAQQEFRTEYKEMGIAECLMQIRFNLRRADTIMCEETDRHALEYIRKIVGLGIRCLQEHGCPEPKVA